VPYAYCGSVKARTHIVGLNVCAVCILQEPEGKKEGEGGAQGDVAMAEAAGEQNRQGRL